MAPRQHADLCKNISGEAVSLHTILLGVGGTCYNEHTLDQFKQLEQLDHQRANTLARKLHAYSVMYANKLVTTRRAIENNNTSHSQMKLVASWWMRLTALLGQRVSFSSNDVGRVSSAYVLGLVYQGRAAFGETLASLLVRGVLPKTHQTHIASLSPNQSLLRETLGWRFSRGCVDIQEQELEKELQGRL
eukprot:1161631-Pelagomonas_calceolata.AAC.1